MGQPIDQLTLLAVNGTTQWVQFQGQDQDLPLLLILHGGPGYAILPLFHHTNPELESRFLVVNWDQRGAGRSFARSIPDSTMNLAQFLDDVHTVTTALKNHFGKKKIYLLGHSWGTVLGLQAIATWPNDYHAFFGVGQVVNLIQNEIRMYEWTLDQAIRQHHFKAIRQLRKIGHPNHGGIYPRGGDEAYDIAVHWMAYFGGEIHGKHGSDFIDEWMLRQPVYSGKWQKKWIRGFEFSQQLFDDPAVWHLDFPSSVTGVGVPVYLLQGHHDYDTPWTLIPPYFEQLKAPDKALYFFENSAHFPFYEEPQLFTERMFALLDRIRKRGQTP
jgi:pimeloyl-ACP methyl ester carboxylesterase